MAVKIAATADIHIGRISSNSASIGDRGSSRESWFRLVEWALEQRVDALALAGDIVEHDNRYFEAAGALETGLTKLEEANIPVFLVAGNHDYDVLPALLKDHGFDHVHLLGRGGNWEVKTVTLNGTGVQFAGWSFPEPSYRTDPLGEFPSEKIDSGRATIGLIHGDYEAVESPYAPLRHAGMTGHGVDAWIMGHIHKPEVFQSGDPLIFYPGSPHALSPKERGVHGPFLLTVEGRRVTKCEQIPLSPVRYEEVNVDITGCGSEDEIRTAVMRGCEQQADDLFREDAAGTELLCFDAVLTGRHENLSGVDEWVRRWDYREFQRNRSGYRIIIRKIRNRSSFRAGNLEALSRETGPAGLLARAILDLEEGNPSEFLEGLRKDVVAAVKDLNVHKTYLPVRDSAETDQIEPEDASVDQLLLNECHRLLSELVTTKEQEEG